MSDSIHLHQSVSFCPPTESAQCPSSQLVPSSSSHFMLPFPASLLSFHKHIIRPIQRTGYTHVWNSFTVTSGDMLPSHYPLPTTCHTGLLVSSSLGQRIITSYEPLTYNCFRWSVNGLFTTCYTARSLFMEIGCGFHFWDKLSLKCIQHQQPPFSPKHLWLSVPCHCQPIFCKFIHHLTFRLAFDNNLFRQLLHKHTFAIYNHIGWYLLPSVNDANIMVTCIFSLPVAFISRFSHIVIDSVIW